jgi:2-alkenal reductase
MMQNSEPPRRRTARTAGLVILAAFALAVSGFTGAAAGGVAVFLAVSQRPSAAAETLVPVAAPVALTSVDVTSSVTDAVQQVSPAVVTVINHLPRQRSILGQMVEPTASGSGVILSSDGYVVTNNHVVDGAGSLEVTLSNGTTLPAELIGVDPFADLAVVRVRGSMPAVASWGNSDELKAGETVIAIGSPLGEFVNTVTVGVISATDRSIQTNPGFELEGLLQTDAAINQGNSGGPLVNLAGQVVGINTLVVRGNGSTTAVAEGLGFSIASNTARAVVGQLIDHGFVSHPYLGINWRNVTPQIAQAYSLGAESGVLITEIDPSGPAGQAGIEQGDILTSLDGQTIGADSPFINLLFNHQPGETVSLGVVRGHDSLQVSVTLGERPSA